MQLVLHRLDNMSYVVRTTDLPHSRERGWELVKVQGHSVFVHRAVLTQHMTWDANTKLATLPQGTVYTSDARRVMAGR